MLKAKIIVKGNCMMCGKPIDSDNIFFCKECERRNGECLHERLKVVDTSTVRLERPIMAKEPKRKPKDKVER